MQITLKRLAVNYELLLLSTLQSIPKFDSRLQKIIGAGGILVAAGVVFKMLCMRLEKLSPVV